MFAALGIIIVLLAGCDDESTSVVNVRTHPTVVDAPCDWVAKTEQGTIYFYAEASTASTVLRVNTCTVRDMALIPVACEPTSQYSVRDGVVRMLCGTFTRGRLTKADFVRVEVEGGSSRVVANDVAR